MSSRQIHRRCFSVLSLCGCLILVTGGVALAHYLAIAKYVWEDGSGKCLKNRSEISDGNTDGGRIRGFSKVNGFAQKEAPLPKGYTSDCAVGWSRDLRVKAELQKKGTDGVWRKCTSTGWKQVYSTEVEIRKYWNADCGAGYYRTRGYAQLLYNGEWVPKDAPGNVWWVDTSSHYLK